MVTQRAPEVAFELVSKQGCDIRGFTLYKLCKLGDIYIYLYYIILYYIILYHIILYYIILCYIIDIIYYIRYIHYIYNNQ
jgi:hypothetical protein